MSQHAVTRALIRIGFAQISLPAVILAGSMLLSGCAAGDLFSAQGGTDEEPRVNCKCGTWAGTKGAPTQCKKVLQERQRQRQLNEAHS